MGLIILLFPVLLTGCLAGEALVIRNADNQPFPYRDMQQLRVLVYQPNCVRDCIGGSEASEATNNEGGVNLTSGMGASTIQETISQSEQ